MRQLKASLTAMSLMLAATSGVPLGNGARVLKVDPGIGSQSGDVASSLPYRVRTGRSTNGKKYKTRKRK